MKVNISMFYDLAVLLLGIPNKYMHMFSIKACTMISYSVQNIPKLEAIQMPISEKWINKL